MRINTLVELANLFGLQVRSVSENSVLPATIVSDAGTAICVWENGDIHRHEHQRIARYKLTVKDAARLLGLDPIYTLIRHTGYTETAHYEFANAVEERSIEPGQVKAIREAGGLIFNSYNEASDRAEAENYPPEVQGLIPRVRGSFAKLKDGTEFYVPLEKCL